MRFVITGTGRSGTMYTARVLSAAGFQCGHEEYFRPYPSLFEKAATRPAFELPRAAGGRLREWNRRRSVDLDGDSSWMAVPRLSKFDGLKILQVRHPLPVIRSFIGTKFFSRPDLHKDQHGFAAAHFDVTGDDMIDAMRWWVHWNSLAQQHSDIVVRLEDLDTPAIANILENLGAKDASALARRAVESVTPDSNSSESRNTRLKSPLTRDSLPDGPEKIALEAAAIDFGYQLDNA